MPRFLALYITGLSVDEKAVSPIDPETETGGMEAWLRWRAENKNEIVDSGAPLGRTVSIDRSGINGIRNDATGDVIVEAATLSHAAEMFRDHPHFSIFKGARVEDLECMENPGERPGVPR